MWANPSHRQSRATGFTAETVPTARNGLTVSMNPNCLCSVAATSLEKVGLGERLLLTILDAVYVGTRQWPCQRVEPPSTART